MTDVQTIMEQWARLGAMFNVKPASRTPDLEALLIDTAHAVGEQPRLFAMTASWLIPYQRLVCRHRLAARVKGVRDMEASATMGYLLSTVQARSQSSHLSLAARSCRAIDTPLPLYHAYRRSAALTALAKESCDPLARPWGLWAPPEDLYDDALRPADWIMRRNPSLQWRAVFSGQLTATILVTLDADPHAGDSESALARACNATRCAVRDALDHLELCRLVTRDRSGHSASVCLTQSME